MPIAHTVRAEHFSTLDCGFMERSVFHPGRPWQRTPLMERLLSNAEARKNLAQQVIGRECAGDGTQVQLRLAQIFGQ